METGYGRNRVKLYSWIIQSYVKTIIIPLILIAALFILVFVFSNRWTVDEIEHYMALDAQDTLTNLTRSEANGINNQLIGVRNATDLYALETKRALSEEAELRPEDAERFGYSDQGAFVTTRNKDSDGMALIYSNFIEVGAEEIDKIARLLSIEESMKNNLYCQPLAVSIYFNTYDQLNVIYPYFDTASQYPPDMDLPSYNFYYEADAAHNPGRDVVWTDVYLDPAGHGWMASAISPVYKDDFLEGVAGIDITVATITDEILDMDIPWMGYGLLVGKDGTILAMPGQGEVDFGLQEMTTHSYQEAIKEDTLKPDQFNIFKREDTLDLSERMNNDAFGYMELELGGRSQVAAWSTIEETGWNLVVFVPQEGIFMVATTLANRLNKVGISIILGLIAAYLLVLGILSFSARKFSTKIANHLQSINSMVQRIGDGFYAQERIELSVVELDETADKIVEMGHALEEALNSNALLKSANTLKSDFIANMSHEIRTPVNAILGFSMILNRQITDPQQKVHLETIQKACSTLLNIINDILDLSKLESGGAQLHPEPVNLSEELNNIADLYAYEQTRKQIKMEIHQDPELPDMLVLDGIRIRQILLNLVGNAFKFTDSGTISISTWKDGNGREAGSINLKIAVQDTGIGIEELQQQKVFEPFRQVEDQNVRKYGGTGLGLTIVKRFVELMGGTISLQSIVGLGSTFTIELPDVMVVDLNDESLLFEDVLENNEGVTAMLEEQPVTSVRDFPEILTDLASENIKKDPELQRTLDNLCQTQCRQAAATNRMRDFHEVANNLMSLGQSHEAGFLISFAENLKQSAESFNLEQIRQLIREIIEFNGKMQAGAGEKDTDSENKGDE